MIVVVALGLANTVGPLVTPSAPHRRTDAFRSLTLFSWRTHAWVSRTMASPYR
jgi:hypothetical protein